MMTMETIKKTDDVELICPYCQTSDYLIFIKNTSEDPFDFNCKCEDCDKLFAYKRGRNQFPFDY